MRGGHSTRSRYRTMTGTYLLSFIALFMMLVKPGFTETLEEWETMAKAELDQALNMQENHNVAKNVIMFVGDGMGISTVTAGRVLKAQMAGKKGQQPLLVFEKFPHVGLSKTYSNDRLTASSASTATAFLTGVKVNDGTLGVSPAVNRLDCAASQAQGGKITSILKWSIDEGKSAGLVTTSRVSHATPAAAYAHSADRYWEGATEAPAGCPDIASQLVDNMDLKVVLGGGRRYFLLNNETDPRTESIDSRQRNDSRNLIKEWKDKHTARNMNAKVVFNKGEFDQVNADDTDYLLGLFAPSHMYYDADRDKSAKGEPSIAEMTAKAIKIMKKTPKGFFLLVEGARIDHGHHNNSGKRALLDTIALDEAVAVAVAETDEKDTLIVVTADHSHVFSIAGYPPRDNDILGFVDPGSALEEELPYDKYPWTVLIYGNGPGPGRTNLTGVDTTHIDFQQPNAVRMKDETHGGEDVAIYARGPMSHLFHGVHEQHYIAHVMAYASCVGKNKNHCKTKQSTPSAGPTHLSSVTFTVCVLFTKYVLYVMQ